MSKFYVIGKKLKNEYGKIGISNVVFEDIAFETIKEIGNVRVDISYNNRKIECEVVDNILKLNIDILVNTNTNISKITENIQNTICHNIRNMTGFENISINIKVKGFFIV